LQRHIWPRAGTDLVPLMLAGSSGRGGKGPDFSGMHTAVLWGGSTVLAAALVRAFGPSLAEVPLIATRPEAQARPQHTWSAILVCLLSTFEPGDLLLRKLAAVPACVQRQAPGLMRCQ